MYEISVSEVENIVEKEIKVYENRVLKHLKAIHITRGRTTKCRRHRIVSYRIAICRSKKVRLTYCEEVIL